MTLSIPGRFVDSGEHQVVVHAVTKEVGPVSIEFADIVP